jgi:predicted nucleotidyltransferase
MVQSGNEPNVEGLVPERIKTDPVLQAFLASLSGVRGRILEITLFGSRARGDEKPFSDYDILVVVAERERDLVHAIHDAVMDALMATGRLITPKIWRRRDVDRWTALTIPLFENIRREGIRIG